MAKRIVKIRSKIFEVEDLITNLKTENNCQEVLKQILLDECQLLKNSILLWCKETNLEG